MSIFSQSAPTGGPAAPPGEAPTKSRTTKKSSLGTDRFIATGQPTVLAEASRATTAELYRSAGSSEQGLSQHTVVSRRERFGLNEVDHDRPAPAILQFLKTFTNPFIVILLVLVSIMFVTDVLLADPAEGPEYTGIVTISIMVLASATLRFLQEYRSSRSAERLQAMVRTTTAVTRRIGNETLTREVPIEELVPGDVVQLAAGDMIPGDIRLVRTKDLQINQAMLTGEAIPAEKYHAPSENFDEQDILAAENLGFMGTSVVSGSGTGVVIGTGATSYFGNMSKSIVGARPETAFDLGIKSVTRTLIQFMLVMVPIVFILNGLTKDWTSAFLFGVTTAVGLTPEMLPLLVTANLAKGAQYMAKRKVIVKRLNSIQNLGAMDVLATDKTGTLTEDRIVLERHLDVRGKTSPLTLSYATANAHFQTGLRNLLDAAILTESGPAEIARTEATYRLVDEVPFDFERRRMSVVVADNQQHLLITKGAMEEILGVSTHELVDGKQVPLTPARTAALEGLVYEQNSLGMRVLAVATRAFETDPDRDVEYSSADESNMVLTGFLAFLDPPKESARAALQSMADHGIAPKVITGDNPTVAASVCADVGLDVGTVILGAEVENLQLAELAELAERTTVFAKVNPTQKARIVEALRLGGHTVGFLGDGINDAPALRAADVGISVDTAVDIAKESADIILLEKDLTVLEGGVLEGRRTFVNTMKYIKATASSNFGNMFSVVVASAMLPFLPMIPLVVLVMNLSYDLSMLTLPWDSVDKEEIRKPRVWESKSLARFMIRIGPISSIFDITTYLLMWFVFQANTVADAALFQTGWFVESILTQTLVVHMLRTRKIPFIQSRASMPVMVATGAVMVFGVLLPYTAWGASLGLVTLPLAFYPWLIATVLTYVLLTQFLKTRFIKKFDSWI